MFSVINYRYIYSAWGGQLIHVEHNNYAYIALHPRASTDSFNPFNVSAYNKTFMGSTIILIIHIRHIQVTMALSVKQVVFVTCICCWLMHIQHSRQQRNNCNCRIYFVAAICETLHPNGVCTGVSTVATNATASETNGIRETSEFVNASLQSLAKDVQ